MFVKSSSMDPAYSAPVSGLAYIYFKDGDLDKAALYYIRAADIALEKKRLHTRKEYFHEELGDIFNNLGAVYERKYRAQGEEKYYEEALEKYRKAVFYRPDSPVAYYNIGVLNWHRRNWEGVEYYFSLALERDPDNQDIVRFLRQARENLRRTR